MNYVVQWNEQGAKIHLVCILSFYLSIPQNHWKCKGVTMGHV